MRTEVGKANGMEVKGDEGALRGEGGQLSERESERWDEDSPRHVTLPSLDVRIEINESQLDRDVSGLTPAFHLGKMHLRDLERQLQLLQSDKTPLRASQ